MKCASQGGRVFVTDGDEAALQAVAWTVADVGMFVADIADKGRCEAMVDTAARF